MTPERPHAPAVPAPAATLMVVREGRGGPEVLLQQRSHEARFVAGAWVFPGGRVDPADADPAWDTVLGPRTPGRAWWITAIRETFEEAGLLYARHRHGHDAQQREQWRAALTRGDCDFLQLCLQEGLTPDLTAVRYVSHWITPPALPIRFDTRFFIAQAPDGQEADHRAFEAIDTRWMAPLQALTEAEQGRMTLILPTQVSLQAMREHTRCSHLIESLARALPEGVSS